MATVPTSSGIWRRTKRRGSTIWSPGCGRCAARTTRRPRSSMSCTRSLRDGLAHLPPRLRDLRARRVLPRRELLVQTTIAGATDPPLAVDLHVLVLVERGAAYGDVGLRVDDDVVEAPDAARRGARHVDLGLVHPMAGERVVRAEGATQELHDLVAAAERVFAARIRRLGVLGEERCQLVPALLIEKADVAVLEPLDRLDFLQVVHVTPPEGPGTHSMRAVLPKPGDRG